MGKKKRQIEHTVVAGEDSSDSNDESPNKIAGVNCPHANKAANLVCVKDTLKKDGLPKGCEACGKIENNPCDGNVCLFICLKCGNAGCETGHKHAEQHSKNKQSQAHDLALNSMSWIVWCFKCNIEIPSNYSKKVLDCVEVVKKFAISANSNIENPISIEQSVEIEPLSISVGLNPRKSSVLRISNSLNNIEGKSVQNLDSLPKVRGLVNLGNTCFFNAVLQCLAQTPFLIPLLEEIEDGGETFRLPGGEVEIAKEKIYLEPLEGVLKEWGQLTRTLVETLNELRSGKSEVFSPKRLLSLLHTKCPQFAGFDQHDSHELLRQLLEMVRTEDLQRYQRVILEKFNLDKKSVRDNSSDELKRKIAAYGRQANNLLLRPEQVFRGLLVSTLECQECHNISEHVESFLDLSLPVMADKPVHTRRKSNSEEGGDLSPSQPSKHQIKKNRKLAARCRKSKHKMSQPSNASGDALGPDKNAKNSSDSDNQDPSDADVEDNEEIEMDINQTQDVVESGYSSEKHVNGDSTCDSPTSETNVHMNRDSAIASPTASDNFNASKPTDEILNLAIPDNPLSKDNNLISSPGSQVSMACQPSPLTSSSEASANVERQRRGDNENGPEGKFRCGASDIELDSDSPLENSDKYKSFYVGNNSGNVPPRVVVVVDKGENLKKNTDLNAPVDLTSGRGESDSKIDKIDHQLRQLDLETSKREKQGGVLGIYEENEEDETSLSKTKDNWLVYGQRNAGLDAPGECTLHSCLNQFTAKELLTNNNKVRCEACTKRINHGKEGKSILTNASKQLLVSSPPAILILHLKRFQVVSFTFKKKSREVKFPLVFDLTPYCSTKCKDGHAVKNDQTALLYSLYGVVEHMGTLHGGHYVAYVKVREPIKQGDPRWSFLPNGSSNLIAEKTSGANVAQNGAAGGAVGGAVEPPSGKWYYVSDSMVSEVKEEKILRSQAYLLFYERFW